MNNTEHLLTMCDLWSSPKTHRWTQAGGSSWLVISLAYTIRSWIFPTRFGWVRWWFFFSVVSSSGSILMHVPLAFRSMLLILASCWLFCHLLLLVGGISLASCYDSPAPTWSSKPEPSWSVSNSNSHAPTRVTTFIFFIAGRRPRNTQFSM